MLKLSTDTQPGDEPFAARAAVVLRRLAAAALLVVGVVMTFSAGVVIALAALAVALIVAAGAGVMWALSRIAGPRRPTAVTPTLEAQKGPRGWTVETRRFSF